MTETDVAFNPFEPGYFENPYPQFEALRDHDPVHETPFGTYFVTRHADVLRLLRDPSMSVSDEHAAPTPMDDLRTEVFGDENDLGGRRLSMLDRDPPDHTRLRRLVSRIFTPRRIGELAPRIQELVDGRLDALADAAGGDLIGELAFPLPFDVISEMLGMPDSDRDQVRDWSGTVVRSLEPVVDPEVLKAIAEAGTNLDAMIREVIEWKRRHPDDRLLSMLIEAEDDGDVLDDDELAAQVLLLFVAGHETTVNLIGNGVKALIDHPDELVKLRAEPGLIESAVEEILRYDSPVQMSRRINLSDHELHGTTIPKGTFIVAGLAAANRDPRQFGETAGRLDITRADAREHVAFGGGAHYCLGAALARLEAQTAIGSLVNRFAFIEPRADAVYNGRINLRGLDTYDVALG